jgi:hypothetical protein
MSEENQEQSFEDAFNELVDGPADSEPAAETIEEPTSEESQDGELQGQEEEAQEQAGVGVLDSKEDPEPEEAEQPDPAAELAATKLELEKWQHKYNSDLGRQNAYQRQIQEKDQLIAQLQSAQSANPGVVNKHWDTLKEDYPDIAQGISSLLEEKDSRHAQEIEALRNSIAPIQAQAQESFVAQQYQMLEREHPDYAEIAASPEFNQWVQTQPQNVQQMMESDNAADAAYLLRTYKNETSPGIQANSELKQRREKQLRQAQNVPSRGGRSQQVMPPDDDFEAAFDYFADR